MQKKIKSIEKDNQVLIEGYNQDHHLDYTIKGNDLQLLIINLKPGQTIIAEAGALNYMQQDINFKTKLGNGENNQNIGSKILGAISRAITKESLFITHFTNKSEITKSMGLAPAFPGAIIPINLKKYNYEIICQKGAFIAATKGTIISVAMVKKIESIFFGGEGFILQRLKGKGTAFIHAGGTVIKKSLDDEEITIDTGSLVAFTKDLQYSVRVIKSMKSMLFAQEGLFLTTLSGTGEVWIQSLPFNRLVTSIVAHMPKDLFKNN